MSGDSSDDDKPLARSNGNGKLHPRAELTRTQVPNDGGCAASDLPFPDLINIPKRVLMAKPAICCAAPN